MHYGSFSFTAAGKAPAAAALLQSGLKRLKRYIELYREAPKYNLNNMLNSCSGRL